MQNATRTRMFSTRAESEWSLQKNKKIHVIICIRNKTETVIQDEITIQWLQEQTSICLSDWKMVLRLWPSISSITRLIGAINWTPSVRGRGGEGTRGRGGEGALCSRCFSCRFPSVAVGVETAVFVHAARPSRAEINMSPGDRSQPINQWHGNSDWPKCHQLHN